MPKGQRNPKSGAVAPKAAIAAPAAEPVVDPVVEQAEVLERVGATADDLQPPVAEAEKQAVEAPKASKIKTVPMERDGKSADVHPNEVEHMKQHGWTEKG